MEEITQFTQSMIWFEVKANQSLTIWNSHLCHCLKHIWGDTRALPTMWQWLSVKSPGWSNKASSKTGLVFHRRMNTMQYSAHVHCCRSWTCLRLGDPTRGTVGRGPVSLCCFISFRETLGKWIDRSFAPGLLPGRYVCLRPVRLGLVSTLPSVAHPVLPSENVESYCSLW